MKRKSMVLAILAAMTVGMAGCGSKEKEQGAECVQDSVGDIMCPCCVEDLPVTEEVPSVEEVGSVDEVPVAPKKGAAVKD